MRTRVTSDFISFDPDHRLERQLLDSAATSP